jgi:hypothetical protein
MSIWCSWPWVGHDPFDGEAPRGGEVRTYAQGFSNHYPDTSGSHELPATIDLAHVAPWCVTGHDSGEAPEWRCSGCDESHESNERQVGAWLRLGIAAAAGLNFWAKDAEGNPTRERVDAEVVLDERAVLRLYHDLGDWLMLPKVRSAEEAKRLAGLGASTEEER